jgi:hypothetical protein
MAMLSILRNSSSMVIELPNTPHAAEKIRATYISGDYVAFARALGGHGERARARRLSRPSNVMWSAPQRASRLSWISSRNRKHTSRGANWRHLIMTTPT